MEKSVKVLVPDYFERFMCIGSDCEDTCCKDWNIAIDKNTYNMYRNIKDPDFKAKLSERLKRVKGEGASDSNYAQIILDENRHCKFIEDGLCSIQKKYGAKYLSTTCITFPRKQITKIGVNGQPECSMSMSCPEVIRVALFPSEKMSFKTVEIEKTHGKCLAAQPVSRFDESVNVLAPQAHLLRECCIEIMQERAMSVADRLLTIGMFLNKLRESSDIGKFDAASVLEIATDYVVSAKSGRFNNLVSELSLEHEQVRTAMSTWLINLAVGSYGGKRTFPQFFECVEKLAESLGKETTKLSHLEIRQMADKAADVYWKDFLDERGHILENYFVNHIFANTFPFGLKLGIQHQVLILAESYALFRILLCAPAMYCAENDGKITDDLITKTITQIFKHTSHGSAITNMSNRYIITGRDSLAHISFMLRG